jgi:hypothetical protein
MNTALRNQWAATLLLMIVAEIASARIGTSYVGALSKDTIIRADAIYAGTAISAEFASAGIITQTNRELKGQRQIITYQVDDVLKGPSNSIVQIEVFRPSNLSRGGEVYYNLPLNERTLVFLDLVGSESSSFRLHDPHSPVFVLGAKPQAMLAEDASPVDHVRQEFTEALKSKKRQVVLQAIRAIRQLGLRDETVLVLKDLSRSDDDAIAGSALAALAAAGDARALEECKTFLSSGRCSDAQRHEIAAAIHGIRNDQCIQTLKELSETDDDLVRESARHALRMIRGVKGQNDN